MSDLEHRHEWKPHPETLEIYACDTCGETTPPCPNVTNFRDQTPCGRPLDTHNRICETCLTTERQVLTDIRAAWHHLGTHATILQLGDIDRDARTTGKVEGTIPVPIGAADRVHGQDDFEHILGVVAATPSRTVLDLLRDPDNIIDVLHEHAEEWATQANTRATGNVLDWLTGRMLWAANTLDPDQWDDYRREARKVRWSLRRTAGILPERHDAPCPDCGGKVVQDWADRNGNPYDDGLSDVIRCTQCRVLFPDRGRFDYLNLTTLRALPETHPDAEVTLKEARAVLPRARRNTINVAIHRDRKRTTTPRRIPERGTNHRGDPLYRLGDIIDVLTTNLGESAS